MNYSSEINFADLPQDPFDARGFLLSESGSWTLTESAKFINEQYDDCDTLKRAIHFAKYNLLDAAPSYVDTLKKIGFFPWIEVADEIEKSLNLIMMSFYKNSYDSMRRALELIVVAAFFVSDNTETKKAREWIKSNSNTPYFKSTLEKLIKDEPYSSCEQRCEFKKYVLDVYYRLSDYIHVKGLEKSNSRLTPSTHDVTGVRLLIFNETACKKSLDLFIETTRIISLICVLILPQLLLGFDLERKFGINGPASGFFTEKQAERIYKLIPEHFKNFIDELKMCNEVHSVRLWFDSLPDISDEEFSRQIHEFDTLLNIAEKS